MDRTRHFRKEQRGGRGSRLDHRCAMQTAEVRMLALSRRLCADLGDAMSCRPQPHCRMPDGTFREVRFEFAVCSRSCLC